MNNKSKHLNVMPATALAGGSVTISQTEHATYERGIRLFVTVSGAVAAAGILDAIFLCAVPPKGGAAIPLVGFALANAFGVNGVYCADFYPGAWLPDTLAAGGNLLGAAGIELPLDWAVQIAMGAGNSATIAVDAVVMP